MLFVPSSKLTEGMCVAEDVCDDSGRILIARGQRIGRSHLVRLNRFGIQSLFIDPFNGEKPAAPAKSSVRKECEAVLAAALAPASGEAARPPAIDPAAVRSAAEGLVKSLRGTENTIITLSGGMEDEDRQAQHAVNTAALAVAIGLDLRLSADTLREIGSGMLLHDVGMKALPAEITCLTAPPGPLDIRELRKHTVLGYEYALKVGALSPRSAEIVLSHHERLDGSGYPQGLKGDRITLPMKIAAVAEAYSSLTNDRYGIPAVLPDAAVAWMLRHSGELFDRQIVLALSTRIALYPTGSAVRLSTGERGVVAGTLSNAPRRPIVLIQVDRRGRTLPHPMIVDLTTETGRAVACCAPTLELLEKSCAKGARPLAVDPVLAGIG